MLVDTSDLDPHMIRNGLARQKLVSHDGGCYLGLMEVATRLKIMIIMMFHTLN
jgi:hypothetical protein